MEPKKYELVVYWSAEDDVFAVEVPDLPGCMAHGKTPAEAATNAQDAIELWIDTAREDGDPVPEPRAHGVPFFGGSSAG
jgi:predicted RNase H-like HicB family nuclease